MTPREKILAGVVGLLLVGLLGWMVTGRVREAIDTRQSQISALEDDIDDKRRTKNRGLHAANTIREYERISLPSDPGLARSHYQNWLLATLKEVGAEEVNVKATTRRHRELYHLLRFSVSGQANLQQLNRFLYAFHSTSMLHRLRAFRIKPQPESRRLDLSFTIEALALGSASEDAKLNLQTIELPRGELAEYERAILHRNLFGPPNNPPELERITAQSATRGRSWSLNLKGHDADKTDELAFYLKTDSLTGAKFDRQTGRLSWTPDLAGEFEVTVGLQDDGYPPKSSERSFIVRVSDPPPPRPEESVVVTPPKPKFDPSIVTVFTGSLAVDGEREAWLQVRSSGEVLKLREGDSFDIGTVAGSVERIDDRALEISVVGETHRLELGETLRQAVTD